MESVTTVHSLSLFVREFFKSFRLFGMYGFGKLLMCMWVTIQWQARVLAYWSSSGHKPNAVWMEERRRWVISRRPPLVDHRNTFLSNKLGELFLETNSLLSGNPECHNIIIIIR